MILTKSIIKADIIAAKQAIDYFEQHHNRDVKNIAAYHLQQATEKLIKIQIYAHAADTGNAPLYTHHIERLIVYAETLGFDLIIPDYIREHSLEITDWEAGSRYDVGFSVRVDVLKKTLEAVSEWERKI